MSIPIHFDTCAIMRFYIIVSASFSCTQRAIASVIQSMPIFSDCSLHKTDTKC